MRFLVVLIAGAALLSGCSHISSSQQQAQASEPPAEDWVLIAPPDNTVTVAFLDTFEFLPDGDDRFPGGSNGATEEDRRSLEGLFDRVRAAPSAEAGLEILTETSSRTEAPVGQWRRVREFKSEHACEATRAELITVTSEQTRKFGAYAGMPREEFQWPLLARSFEWSRCVRGTAEAPSQG